MPVSLSRRAALAGLASFPALACAPGPRAQRTPRTSFERVRALIARYADERKVAGLSVAVHAGGETRFISAGTLALDTELPAAADSLYRIYSMTKPITGVAALLCIEDGRLGLDQPVADFVPEFGAVRVLTGEGAGTRAARTQITPRHLMTHTAGFTYHFFGTPLAQRYLAAGITPDGPTPILGEDLVPPPATLDEFGTRLAQMPLDFEPGARWQYAVGLDLLALVIQRASGIPYEEFLATRLFQPLGMSDTNFFTPADKVARLSTNYGVEEQGALIAIDDRNASPFAAPSMPCGGAGLVSSAADYARFCAMLLGRGALDGVRVAAAETIETAHANLLPDSVDANRWGLDGARFGAGMRVVTAASAIDGEEPAGAYGWSGAAGTHMWVDPANQAFAVLMTQHMPADAYPLGTEFRRAFYADLTIAEG